MNLGLLISQPLVSHPARPHPCRSFCRGAGQQQLFARQLHRTASDAARRRAVVSPQATVSPEHGSSTVRMSVQGRHLEVTPAIQDHVRTRITKAVHNFEGGLKEVNVRLSASGGDRGVGAPRQRAEVTVYTLRNGVVRAEETQDSLYAAIDLVSDKLKQQLRKMKEKAISRGKWQGSGGPKGAKVISEVIDWEDAQYNFPLDKKIVLPDDVVRTKTFLLQDTTIEQATEQLEQVGHDFFIFKEKESGEIRVLYKRKHSGLGLIVPLVK